MGSCLSTADSPIPVALQGDRASSKGSADSRSGYDGRCQVAFAGPQVVPGVGSAAVCGGVAAGPKGPLLSAGAAIAEHAALMDRIHDMQQDLAMLSTNALLAISEAAELLVDRLGADFVGVCAFAPDDPDCAILLAAHGSGADALLERPVMRGASWAAPRLPRTDAHKIYIPDVDIFDQSDIPRDFAILRREAGLRSFVAARIGPLPEPFGALIVASSRPHAFEDAWAALWPPAASTALLQQLRPAHVVDIAQMLQLLEGVSDPVAAISLVLQGGARFLWRATNIRMGLRLAVLSEDPSAAASGAVSGALLFESARASTTAGGGSPDVTRRTSNSSASSRSVALPADPNADVAVREMPLANTLLHSAVSLHKARFVSDCAAYLQRSRAPARDVFTHASDAVASVVVVPMVVRGASVGAVYFTQGTPCDFLASPDVSDALLAFVHAVTLPLHARLAGQTRLLKSMVAQANRCFSSELPLSEPLSQVPASTISSDSFEAGDMGGSVVEGASNANSTRLSKVSSSRLCTEAILRVLQQDIRRSRRRSLELSALECSCLVIGEPLGRGGYGSVYAGTWYSTPAAIKVMNARRSNSEAVSDAMEMAVLSSVQSPNIVQVFACLTDMVPVVDVPGHDSASSCGPNGAPWAGEPSAVSAPASASAAASAAPRRLRFRRMLPGEDPEAPTYNIIVMEFCERGTLRDAVREGLFHRQLENGAIGVDLASVLDILLDVAHALSYLHRINLLHGDVKLDNILLKTEANRLVPKLADLGCAKILCEETNAAVNHTGAGTVTHLAPEMLCAGSRVTTAVDSFAFGVLMWELYCRGRRPYAGLTREAIIDRVLRGGARPAFPAGTPPGYLSLASKCWAPLPADRPAFPEIVARLHAASAEIAALAGQRY